MESSLEGVVRLLVEESGLGQGQVAVIANAAFDPQGNELTNQLSQAEVVASNPTSDTQWLSSTGARLGLSISNSFLQSSSSSSVSLNNLNLTIRVCPPPSPEDLQRLISSKQIKTIFDTFSDLENSPAAILKVLRIHSFVMNDKVIPVYIVEGSLDILRALPGAAAQESFCQANNLTGTNKSLENLSLNATKSFLQKLKEPSAASLLKDIKNFINDFMNKNLTTDVRSNTVQEFLQKMNNKIQTHQLWQNVSNEELDETFESFEKYLMSKIYAKAFAPPEDVEKDSILTKKIYCLQFIQKKHLDIKTEESYLSKVSLSLARKALEKMNLYKSPLDKCLQIILCCNVVLNSLKHSHQAHIPVGADDFIPMLIYMILQTKPQNLISNLMYIQRYRNIKKLSSEAGYYVTNLQAAVLFIENLSASSISINSDEYYREYRLLEEKYEKEQEKESAFILVEDEFISDLSSLQQQLTLEDAPLDHFLKLAPNSSLSASEVKILLADYQRLAKAQLQYLIQQPQQ